jgi:hypothetical protein
MQSSIIITILKAIGEGLRRLVSIILLISFSLLTSLLLLGTIFTDTLTQSQTWIQALDSTQFTERSQPLLSEILMRSPILGNTSRGEQLTQLSIWENIVQVLVPSNWVDENLHMFVQSVSEWIRSPDIDMLEFTLNLTPIKDNLKGPQGTMVILPLLQNAPPCSDEVTEIVVLGEGLVNCLPKHQDLTYIAGVASSIIAETLPNQVSITTLAEVNAIDKQIFQYIYGIKARYEFWRSVLDYSLIISMFVFCLYLLLQTKSITFFIQAIPRPFYAAGFLLLALFGGWYAFIRWGQEYFPLFMPVNLSLENQALINDLIGTVGSQPQEKWLIWGIGLLLAAILFQFGGRQITKLLEDQIEDQGEAKKRRLSIRKQYF